MKHVYLDNAATTPMAPEVIAKMTTTMQNVFGNASTPNYYGRQARNILDQARSTALARQHLGKHIITTSIEHEAVLKPLQYLESQGFEITYLPVDKYGQIKVADVQKALRSDTILVSIMMVNNEIGVINPIQEIGELLQNHQAVFHTDAVQGYGSQDIDVQDLKVDLLTTSAHKLNGPKMMGFLYESKDLNIPPLIRGGDQETKRRAGTENIPAIAGFAQAVELNSPSEKKQTSQRLASYKQLLVQLLQQNKVDFQINGPQLEQAAPNILNLWLPGWETSILQIKLDLAGFIVSGGSACTAGSLEPSHVLQAMFGHSSPRINESIRISFNKYTQKDDILKFARALTQIVQQK